MDRRQLLQSLIAVPSALMCKINPIPANTGGEIFLTLDEAFARGFVPYLRIKIMRNTEHVNGYMTYSGIWEDVTHGSRDANEIVGYVDRLVTDKNGEFRLNRWATAPEMERIWGRVKIEPKPNAPARVRIGLEKLRREQSAG